MNEDVLAAVVAGNKSESLDRIEELNLAGVNIGGKNNFHGK